MTMSLEKLPLRNRHQVYFHKQPEYNYYIYNNDKWNSCKNVDSLPYGLTIFQLEDGTEIPTCQDSFRLVTKEQYDNGEIPTNDEIEYEQTWRSKMLEKDELDFYSKDEWIKAEIAWKKADIVPNVWNIVKRKSSNWIGYYYYESKRIAPSSTHTYKYSKEELELELQQENENRERIKIREEKFNNIKKGLKKFTYKNENEIDLKYTPIVKKEIYNILDYYLSLDIQETLSEESIKAIVKNPEDKFTAFDRSLISVVHTNCEGCFVNDYMKIVNNSTFIIHYKYDSYYDLYIELNDYSYDRIEKVYMDFYFFKIDGVYEKETNRIVFPDFYRNNPLITLEIFYTRVIPIEKEDILDSLTLHFKGIIYNCDERIFILGKNPYYPNYIKSKNCYLFLNGLGSGFDVDENELELV